VLLDTHVFLWLQTEPERLGAQFAVVQDERNRLLLSAASSWEIAIKHGLGRLPLPEAPARYVPRRMRAIGAEALDVEHAHALAVAELPHDHGDPFDRLLVAQARSLEAQLLTADAQLARYAVRILLVGG
jgi:PIN domain nuclease of toxin-antitoxin system